jgi:hypothetical protein
MKKLWELPESLQRKVVEARLCKYGTLIGEMSSPHSNIYTFDLGVATYPRYVVAKGIQVEETMSDEDRRKYFARALYEVNNAYAVFHHPLAHRFFDVDIILGVPFLLSRKRDATLRDVISEGTCPIARGFKYCRPNSTFVVLLRAAENCLPPGLKARECIHRLHK